MNKKTFSTITFISHIVILLYSIFGLIMLNLSYLIASGKTYLPGFGMVNISVNFTGYQLIFENAEIGVEPLLHFIGFILFLVGSLIFISISIINYLSKDESKKIQIKYDSLSKNNNKLKTLGICISIFFVLLALTIIVFGFLCFYNNSIDVNYRVGAAKIINAFLLGFNFLILAFILNLNLYNARLNISK